MHGDWTNPGATRLPRAARPMRGFGLVEVIVAVAIAVFLIALVFAAASQSRDSAGQVNCLNNLRQIGAGFREYALDNGSALPAPFAAGRSWESLLESYAGGGDVFVCPMDAEVFPAVGSSYDWRDTGDPATTLAGRKLDGNLRGDAVVAFDALPGWHHAEQMNAVLLNAAVTSMEQSRCLNDLFEPVSTSPPRGR